MCVCVCFKSCHVIMCYSMSSRRQVDIAFRLLCAISDVPVGSRQTRGMSLFIRCPLNVLGAAHT